MDTTRIEVDIAEKTKDLGALTRILDNLTDDLDRATVQHVRSRLREDIDYAQQAMMRLEVFSDVK